MFKKFSFWAVFALLASIGFMVFIHWSALQGAYQKTASFKVLAHRQKVIDSMTLSLEKYRRMSSSFRKMGPDEVDTLKQNLRSDFKKGTETLDQLDPLTEEKVNTRLVRDELNELLSASARIEPMLFSKDAYIKAEVQEIHEQILNTLNSLKKSNDHRVSSLELNSPTLNSKSVVLLLGVGAVILFLFLSILLKNYMAYLRPLRKLHRYADDLRKSQAMPDKIPSFSGVYSEIQKTLNQLAMSLQTHVKDRHKFIQDIVTDLKAPLALLQSGRHLLGGSGGATKTEISPEAPYNEEQKHLAAESVNRGLALVSGSLNDLDDIININQLENRLEERVVDLSDMISDLCRRFLGSEASRRIKMTVPPMPVWVRIDAVRFERMLIQVLSKVFDTLPMGSELAITVSQSVRGNGRGVEIAIQDSERLKGGRPIPTGPEQDLVKHWVSEKGLSMALAHKIVKAHNGTITVAGVVGTSISVLIRLPQDRVVGNGLITRPSDEARGLVTQAQKPNQQMKKDSFNKQVVPGNLT